MDPKIHGHTWRALQVGIKPTSPPTKVVTLPTKPQMPYPCTLGSCFLAMLRKKVYIFAQIVYNFHLRVCLGQFWSEA
jgi:hypothetical protein